MQHELICTNAESDKGSKGKKSLPWLVYKMKLKELSLTSELEVKNCLFVSICIEVCSQHTDFLGVGDEYKNNIKAAFHWYDLISMAAIFSA